MNGITEVASLMTTLISSLARQQLSKASNQALYAMHGGSVGVSNRMGLMSIPEKF